jgi:hypothetical protein
MTGTAQPVHRDGFPLQVVDGADPLRPEQHQTANVKSREQDERVPCLQSQEKKPTINPNSRTVSPARLGSTS